MDIFELQAKIKMDSSDYENSLSQASSATDAFEQSLRGAGNASGNAENAIDDLGDEFKNSAKQAAAAENAVDDLTQEIRSIDSASDQAENAVKKFGNQAEKTSEKTNKLKKNSQETGESFFKSMVGADVFSAALSKLGDMAKDAARYIWGLDEATKEYRVAQGKLNTAFKVSGFSADDAATAFRNLYRATGDIDRATEASQLLSQLARNQQDVADWTTIATGVVGTFGDSLPVESLIESANETARVGQVVGTLADALNWAGSIGEDQFNSMLASCATEEERVQLITDTLLDTYSNAADVFAETSQGVIAARDAYLEVAGAQAEAGEKVERFKNALTVGSSTAAKGFHIWIGEVAEDLAIMTESANESKGALESWADSLPGTFEKGNIEDVTKEYERLYDIIKFINDHPIGFALSQGGIFTAKGVLRDLEDAAAIGEERLYGTEEGLRKTSNSATELAASLVPIIATANGVSIELKGTGLTAEEASDRLQIYTDSALNMFEKINTTSQVSYQEAVSNLEANIKATKEFGENLTEIYKVLPPAIAETFAAGGPEMYAGVVSMLAEANRGTDVGLTQINDLYSKGGEEAVNSFMMSLNATPEGAETPVTKVAEQMENDSALESAAASAVSKAGAAMNSAVGGAGFASAGSTAIQSFINGMNSKSGAAASAASSIVAAAVAAALEAAGAGGGGGGGGGGTPRAGGLDYVPINDYPARLHRGEAVLTAREAQEWRSGNSTVDNSKSIQITQYISAVAQTPVELAAASRAYLETARW